MKSSLAVILMIVTLGMFSLSQGAETPLIAKKSKEEMEIMRGILNTTLTFFAENSQTRFSRGRVANIRSFYLAGQGAVFEIPTGDLSGSSSDMSFNWGPEISERMSSLQQEIAIRSQEAQAEAMEAAQEAMKLSSNQFASGRSQGKKDGEEEVSPVPPAPTVSPNPPQAADKASRKMAKASAKIEDTRQNMEELKAKIEKRKEAQAARHQKFLQTLSEVRTPLVDALANYGDSLATVKPEEYVNLVLVTEESNPYPRRVDVISARKSWITDYKAGRLTLDAFRQKVLQYNQ